MLYKSLNGNSDFTLSIADRALNYGDGLFTTAKIAEGEIELFLQHLSRLRVGCQKLLIEGVDFNWLENYLKDLAKGYQLAVLKVLISSGEGGRGYSRQGVEQPNVMVTIHPFPEHYNQWQTNGVNLGVANTMLGANPQFSGIKHLNRLEQVMLRKELEGRDEDDLLVLNIYQDIVETTSANIFYQIDNQWYTPQLKISGVDGLMRQHILNKMPDVTVRKDNITALDGVSAMFLTNCIAGVIPVKEFNNTKLDIAQVSRFKEISQC